MASLDTVAIALEIEHCPKRFVVQRMCIVDNLKRVFHLALSRSYVSPEIVSGIPYNAKIADIWSAGIVLFVILNSSMPFDDSNMKKLLKDQCSRNYKYNGKVADSISQEAKYTINSLLEPDAIKRPNTTQILRFDWFDPKTKSKFC